MTVGRKRGRNVRLEERRCLMEGVAQTRVQLNQAYAQFNLHSDPDLVDACGYGINAPRSRYSYLVRQGKRLAAADGGLG